MDTVVKYDNIFQFNESRGVETLHPLVSVIDFSKCGPARFERQVYGFYTIFLKNSVFVEGNTAVQCRLSTKGKHNAIRTFFFDDFLYKIRSDRQEINLVGNAFRSLHSSDIRVDKNGVDTFFFQGFECLAAGVVELTCLADFQCTGTE